MDDPDPPTLQSLSDLLTSIGASPLDPTVAVRTGHASIHSHVVRLNEEIDQSKRRLHETVGREWPKLRSQWQTGDSLKGRITSHEDSLLHLEREFEDPEDGLKVKLERTLEAHSKLLVSHFDSSALLTALSSLAPIFTLLSQTSALIHPSSPSSSLPTLEHDAAPLVQAVESLLDLRGKTAALGTGWVSETLLARKALGRTEELIEETRLKLIDLVRSGLASDGSLTSNWKGWGDVAVALGRLSERDLEKELARMSERVLKIVIEPILSTSSTSSDVFTALRDAFLRLRSTLFSAHMDLFCSFLRYFSPSFQQLLISSLLDPSLPSSPSSSDFDATFSTWTSLSPQAHDFTRWFRAEGWLVEGKGDDGILEKWLEGVGKRWADKIVQKRLEKVRREMVRCSWEGTQVDWEITLPPAPVPPSPPSIPEPTPSPPKPVVPSPPSTSASPAVRSASPTQPPIGGAFRSLFDFSHSNPHHQPSSSTSTSNSRPQSPASPLRNELGLTRSRGTPPPRRPMSLEGGRRSMSGSVSGSQGSRPTLPKELITPSPSPSPSPPSSPIPAPQLSIFAPPPPSASVVVPEKEKVEEKPDEDVDWDLGTDRPLPPTTATAPPTSHTNPSLPSPHPPLSSVPPQSSTESFGTTDGVEDEMVEEDAWGLDEDETDAGAEAAADHAGASKELAAIPLPSSEVASSRPIGMNGSASSSFVSAVGGEEEEEEDDPGAWGFDGEAEVEPEADHDSAASTKPEGVQKLSLVPSNPTKKGHRRTNTSSSKGLGSPMSVEGDGWGFGDEDEELEEQEQAEPLRLRGGAASPTLEGEGRDEWGWEEEVEANEDAEVAAQLGGVTATPQRPRARRRSPPSGIVGAGAGGKTIEKFTVSKLAIAVAEDARQILQEVQTVMGPSFADSELATAGLIILQSFQDLFDLFRAVMPIQHSNLLETVPSLGMQFANDCDWLAKEVERMKTVWPAGAGGSIRVLEMTSERMSALGLSMRSNQMTVQEAALLECLEEADGFRDPADAVRFAACERALKQVTHTLERLSHAWKPVMLPSQYSTSLGQLVDFVLRRILQSIEEMPDIGAGESQKLNELCKSLHGLDALFVEGSGVPSSVARFVPTWFKFSFLSELLEASMADIMWMHEEGMLSEFSTEEIVGLIRALFSDSALRSKNIDKLTES